MPLVPNFYRAIYYADYSVTPSVDHWFSFDIQTSLSALAHNMSQLEANGVRLFRAFYNETANKFEVDNLTGDLIRFAVEFRDFMNFPQVFPAGEHWEIGLSEEVIDAYSHYRVSVKNVNGCHDGRDYDGDWTRIPGRAYRVPQTPLS